MAFDRCASVVDRRARRACSSRGRGRSCDQEAGVVRTCRHLPSEPAGRLEPRRSSQTAPRADRAALLSQVSESGFLREGTRLRRVEGIREARARNGRRACLVGLRRSLASPARAPHRLAGLHESATLPCAPWKCRIRSGAACGPILPDCAMCWTARLRKARRASGRSPIVSVMHLTCATVAAGASAQAAARRWACSRHGATLRCLRPDITAPGDTARECSRRQWRRPTMCRARSGRCASLRWCGSRPTRNAGSGTP